MATEKETLHEFMQTLARDIRRVEHQREIEAGGSLELYKPLTNQEWAGRIGLDHQDTFRKHRHGLRRPDDGMIALYATHFDNERYYDIFGLAAPSLKRTQERLSRLRAVDPQAADEVLKQIEALVEKKGARYADAAQAPKTKQGELVPA